MTEALGGDWLRKSIEFEGLTPPAGPTPVALPSPALIGGSGDVAAHDALVAELAAERAAKELVSKELKSYKAMYDKQRDLHNETEVKLKAQVCLWSWRSDHACDDHACVDCSFTSIMHPSRSCLCRPHFESLPVILIKGFAISQGHQHVAAV